MRSHNRSERIYLTFNYPNAVTGSKTLLTGIRGIKDKHSRQDILYITGFYEPPNEETISFLYKGDLRGNTGPCSDNSWNILNYPSTPGVTVKATNLYGPLILDNENVRAVGNYTTEETGTQTFGCMYEGPLDGSGKWITLTPTDDTINTIAHSTMGDLVVGNYNTSMAGRAFIYDVNKQTYYNIEKENVKSITAYGIWHNKDNTYTICGGLSYLIPESGLDSGYVVDWNNETNEFSNWKEYHYNNNKAIITHFDGITSDGKGGYNLTGDATVIPTGTLAFFANISRKESSKFSNAIWEQIKYPGSLGTSGNSVYKDIVIGIYTNENNPTVNGYISIVI